MKPGATSGARTVPVRGPFLPVAGLCWWHLQVEPRLTKLEIGLVFGGDSARLLYSKQFALVIMSDQTKEPLSASDLLKNSSLYREFQAEREEILKHKWIESEKAGRDIGFERALTDWIIKHRSKWRRSRQQAVEH